MAGALLPALPARGRAHLAVRARTGQPDNPVDQPYLQGQLGLELVPPAEVWMTRGIEISAAEFLHQIRLLKWLADNRPTDPRLMYRTPVDLAAIPIPRWS